MSIPLVINGATFEYPINFDENWGTQATGWAQAVTNGMLQRQGGNFPLLSDTNFGPTFGLISPYYKSTSANLAAGGTIRLSNTDTLNWRNFANNADLPLGVDTSNRLTFNGSVLAFTGAVNPGTQYQLAYYATTSNIVSGNPNTMAASQVVVNDANGVPTTTGNGGTTATEIGFVHGVTSAIQTQINAITTTTNTVWGPIGSSLLYSSATPPSANYVVKAGQAISRTTYSALFALIGTTFGVGDGSTTFNIPNSTDKFPVGAGNLYALGATGGSTTHTLSVAEIPSGLTVTDPGHNHTQNPHTHAITDPGHIHSITEGDNSNVNNQNFTTKTATNSPYSQNTNSAITGISINNTTATNNSSTTGISVGGGAGSHSILNPYLAEYWMYRII